MTLREYDYLFEWLDRATGSTRKLEPGTSPFYLLFQYRGRENIGAVTDRELALELARKHARETPGLQYIVMRAEVVVCAESTPVVVKQIELESAKPQPKRRQRKSEDAA